MKKYTAMILGAIVIVGCGFAAHASAQSFEGAIDMQMTMRGKTMETHCYYQGNKIRIESNSGGRQSIIITDLGAKTMTQMMPERRMYMTMDMPDAKTLPQPATTTDKPVKTGKTETILGYVCDEWTITDSKRKATTDLWLAHGLTIMPPMSGGMQRNPNAQNYDAIYKEGGFPVRTIVKDSTGTEQTRMEVVKIDKKQLDASLFTPPADYQKMQMPPGMMHPGMQGGAPMEGQQSGH